MLVIFLFAIVSGIAIIIPAKDIIIDPYGRGRSKFKPGGVLLILAVILLIILPVIQYNIQKKEEIIRNQELKRGYDSSLSEIKKKFDSTSFKTDSLIADNLGKYGYKFDSASNRLEKIVRDSSKTRVIEKDDPVLHLRQIENVKIISITPISDKEQKVIIHFSSSDAGSSSFDIKLSCVTLDFSDNLSYSGSYRPFGYTAQISKDGSLPATFMLNNAKNFVQIYFWIRGSYKNIDKSKIFRMDEVFVFDSKTKEYGVADLDISGIIKDKVSKYEK